VQPGTANIKISFAKESIALPKATSFLNVVTIRNDGSETLNGILTVKPPDSWPLIGAKSYEISVKPGETAYYPVRAGIPKNSLGAVSYVVFAELKTDQNTYAASCYVSIQKISRWDMKVLTDNVFLSDFRPVGNFQLKLQNSGNANELIKLVFDIGALLKFKTFIEADSIMFVEMPAYSDTIMNFEVTRRNDIPYAEARALMRNWKSTSIYIKASTPEYETFSGIRVTPLESTVNNDLPEKNSPLNVDFTTFNILSQQKPRATLKIHGRVLFPESQQLQYSFGLYHLYFNPGSYKNFDLYNQLRYMLRYRDKKSSVWIGDRLGTGTLHTMTGNGIKAEYHPGDGQTVNINLIYNPFVGNIGSFAGYQTRIGRAGVNTGVTVESSNNNSKRYYTLHLGGSYNFFNYHTIRLQTATSLSFFDKGAYLAHDTATVGLAYRLSYYFNNRKVKFHIDNTNTTFTYLNNAGINRIDSDLSWKLSKKSRVIGMFYRNNYDPARYPYSFFNQGNRNINENSRLLYSYIDGNTIYQVGPQYFGTFRHYANDDMDIATTYRNYQPGMLGSVTFHIGNLRSITPSLSVNTMYISYSDDISDDGGYKISGRWQYTAGLSYYDQAFRLSAYYSSGDATEIYRSMVVNDEPIISQAVYIRPSYKRYFYQDKIRVEASYNYAYFMPSQRESAITNVRTSFFLNDGWSLFGSMNIYKNSRTDSETGRITTRSLNFLVGFRKAFDIQQPRMKYYDLVIQGFNDQNGDGKKDENEKPVSNILINMKRDPKKNKEEKVLFAETKLITDPNGEIRYQNIAEGTYDLEITPLSNMDDLFFLEGRNQQLIADGDKIQYLPLVESYKVKGKVRVERDPNSNQGRISLEGIRITATTINGSTYSVLTDKNGAFVLNLPEGSAYTVSIVNVFGDRFLLQQGSYEVRFAGNKTINIDFYFREKQREIKFDNDSQIFDFHLNR